tara:strand:+ start:899 stop:2713 length:1815 start_codon:yes stop_codon:yes gene_type:complete
MTDYKAIHGKKIKFLTTDLSTAEAEGEIFYSNTDNGFKVAVATAAWSSGPDLSNALGTTAGSGSQTAAVVFGGADDVAKTEEYNGVGWAASGDLNTGRYGAGEATAAPQTAALIFGGQTPPGDTRRSEVEEYDGSTWTEVTDMPADISQLAGAGTQTAALSISGGPSIAESYEYDGTNWTAAGNINTARERAAGFGTQTAAVAVGGGGTAVANVEEYDGSSWAAATAYPTAVKMAAAAGTLTAGLVFSGDVPPVTNLTRSYDGTNWTNQPNMGTARQAGAGAGTSIAALMSGGSNASGTSLKTTEEFHFSAMTVTAGAWASGGNYPASRVTVAGTGTLTAGLGFGGYDPGTNASNEANEYDGSSWTGGGDMNAGGQGMGSASNATQTAALAFGRYATPGPPNARDLTEAYDGSSWTEVGDLNTARSGVHSHGFGSQTAAVCAGGHDGTAASAVVEEYDGSSWTEVTNLPAARTHVASCGTLTAGLVTGGHPPNLSTSFEYDGTNWTSGGTMIAGRGGHGAAGLQTAAVAFKGVIPTGVTTTEYYDGSVWSTNPACASGQYYVGGAGTVSGALALTGRTSPGYSNTVEEFTGETTAINLKTITDS